MKTKYSYQFTKKRIIILTVVSFLLIDLLLAYNYISNKAFKSQQEFVNSNYEQLRDAVSRIPNPENLTPGLDSKPIETAVDITNTQTTLAKKNAVLFNCTTRDFIFLPIHCSRIGNNTAAINLELDQYSKILDSMDYLITFNAKFFALNFDVTTQASKDKLTKLDEELSNVRKGLETLVDSKEKEDMLEIIKAVEGAKERVAQTGDAQPLELLFETIQEEIVKKLTEYYTSTIESVRDNAQEIINYY